jgi:hypothetical protein
MRASRYSYTANKAIHDGGQVVPRSPRVSGEAEQRQHIVRVTKKVGARCAKLHTPVSIRPSIEGWKDVTLRVGYGADLDERNGAPRGRLGDPVALHIDDIGTVSLAQNLLFLSRADRRGRGHATPDAAPHGLVAQDLG